MRKNRLHVRGKWNKEHFQEKYVLYIYFSFTPAAPQNRFVYSSKPDFLFIPLQTSVSLSVFTSHLPSQQPTRIPDWLFAGMAPDFWTSCWADDNRGGGQRAEMDGERQRKRQLEMLVRWWGGVRWGQSVNNLGGSHLPVVHANSNLFLECTFFSFSSPPCWLRCTPPLSAAP